MWFMNYEVILVAKFAFFEAIYFGDKVNVIALYQLGDDCYRAKINIS